MATASELIALGGPDGEDRVSALNNDVIFHIFSFLDTKDIVRTSVLSKRWMNLWLCTSHVNLPNLSKFTSDGIYNSLNRFLAHPGPQLQLFRLGCLYLKPEMYLPWVPVVALSRHLVKLHLHDLDIPDNIIDTALCSSLHLTSLTLEHAHFKTQPHHFQDTLQFSTPTLTYLALIDCDYSRHRNLTIHTPRLLHLSLHFFNCDLTITAPALEAFSLMHAPILSNYYLEEFPALKNAVIHFGDLDAFAYTLSRLDDIQLTTFLHSAVTGFQDPDADEDPLDQFGIVIDTVLHAIRNATSLQFSSVVFQHFPRVPDVLISMPMLTNLYHLELTDWSHDRFNCFLPVLFAHCPNLQTLFIENTGQSLDGEMVHAEQQQSFQCAMPCLRNIRIESLQTSPREQDFVRFLLRNANRVQNVFFTTESDMHRGILNQFLGTLELPHQMMITVSIRGI